MKLPRATAVTLNGKKQVSLAKKYFSIPPKYKYYYPNVSQEMVAELEAEGGGAPAVATTRSSTKKAPKKSRDSIPGVKKPGRPKGKAPVVGAIAGQRSILTFFKTTFFC